MNTIIKFLFIGFLSISMISCGDEDIVTPPVEETNTIVDIALGDAQFSTLVAALQRTDLVSTLQGDGPFTVFAPTNEAFTALGVDLTTISDDALKEILLYHVIGAEIKSTDLAEGQTYASTAAATGPGGNALSVLVEKTGAAVKLNNLANVTTADVDADNGVIHIIDNVITPLDVVGHAQANSNFTSLVNALVAAPGELVSVLQGDGPFTVFAPVNSGFDAISDIVATLSGDQLASVLTYHVVGGANVLSTDLSNEMEVATVNGQSFMVHIGDKVQIQDSTNNKSDVIVTDVQATNGVIHAVGSVIIPNL